MFYRIVKKMTLHQERSSHHLHGVGEMSTSLQETGEKQVRIAWSTIKLPNGPTQDDDNHAGRDPMNLSPYASSGCLRQEQGKNKVGPGSQPTEKLI